MIVRPLVVQLDKVTTSEHKNWTFDIIRILEKEFGTNNITGFSVHKDETNPHLHISFIPCNETEKTEKSNARFHKLNFIRIRNSQPHYIENMRKMVSGTNKA